MFRKILVPLDGSEPAELALSCAEEMAGRMGSKVILLGVLESGGARYENLYRCYLESRAEKLKEKVLENGGPDAVVTPLLLKEFQEEDLVSEEPPGRDMGHPAADIIHAAAEQGASIILMATQGYSGFRRLALSSVADAIVRGSGLPVLLVRPGSCSGPGRGEICRNIVVPLDGSALAESSLAVVEDMAQKMCGQGMRVSLVHVSVERRSAASDELSASFLENVENPERAGSGQKAESYVQQAERYLKQAAVRLEALGVAVACAVRSGKPEEEISGLAAESGATMVVMACHARSGIGRYIMGSTADRVLRLVDASVLLLRPHKPQPPGVE